MKKLILISLILSGCMFHPDKHSPIKIIAIGQSKNVSNGMYHYHAIDTKRHGGFWFWSDNYYWIGDSIKISKF